MSREAARRARISGSYKTYGLIPGRPCWRCGGVGAFNDACARAGCLVVQRRSVHRQRAALKGGPSCTASKV
jgi:hypothetical protein